MEPLMSSTTSMPFASTMPRRPTFAAFSARLHWTAAACCALALAFAIVAILGTQSARSGADFPAPAFSHATTSATPSAAPGHAGIPEAPRV
jgi:hypothetical protein